MSHSAGEVIVDGQVVAYFEYNGTVDIALPKLWKTQQEVSDNWRRGPWVVCSCDPKTETPATLYSSYGFGFHWQGTVCLTCMAINSPLGDIWEYGYQDGHPLCVECKTDCKNHHHHKGNHDRT